MSAKQVAVIALAAAGLLSAPSKAAASAQTPASGAASSAAMKEPETDTAAIEAAFRDLYLAMLAADTSALGSMLGAGFTLTHITGVVQPRRDWLADIDTRRMVYNSAQELSLSTRRSGDTAVLIARHRVDATIYGGRGRWTLQLAADLVRRDDRWVIEKMVATTFD